MHLVVAMYSAIYVLFALLESLLLVPYQVFHVLKVIYYDCTKIIMKYTDVIVFSQTMIINYYTFLCEDGGFSEIIFGGK